MHVSVNRLDDMLEGAHVLDVGCGNGVLSSQIVANKNRRVTALDHDPKILKSIKPRPNLITVEGSGLDLKAVLGDEKYDVVNLTLKTPTSAGS